MVNAFSVLIVFFSLFFMEIPSICVYRYTIPVYIGLATITNNNKLRFLCFVLRIVLDYLM